MLRRVCLLPRRPKLNQRRMTMQPFEIVLRLCQSRFLVRHSAPIRQDGRSGGRRFDGRAAARRAGRTLCAGLFGESRQQALSVALAVATAKNLLSVGLRRRSRTLADARRQQLADHSRESRQQLFHRRTAGNHRGPLFRIVQRRLEGADSQAAGTTMRAVTARRSRSRSSARRRAENSSS